MTGLLTLSTGDKKGIKRYGNMLLPMDESLILCAVDAGGRACLNYKLSIPTEKVGDFDTELVEEFMTSFTRSAKINLHLKQLDGSNSHHIIEGAFKALARALKTAVSIEIKAFLFLLLFGFKKRNMPRNLIGAYFILQQPYNPLIR